MIFMILFLHTLYTSSTRSVSCEGLVKKLLCWKCSLLIWIQLINGSQFTEVRHQCFIAEPICRWRRFCSQPHTFDRPIRVLFLGLWPSHLNHGGVFDWNAAVAGTSFIPTFEISWNGILAATCGLCFAECRVFCKVTLIGILQMVLWETKIILCSRVGILYYRVFSCWILIIISLTNNLTVKNRGV